MAEETEVKLSLPEGVTGSSKEQHRFRTDKFTQIYANNMALSFSAYDMSVTFGQIVGEQDGQLAIEELSKVLMPLALGKVFAMLLVTNLKAFEAEFGEIKVPDIARIHEARAQGESEPKE